MLHLGQSEVITCCKHMIDDNQLGLRRRSRSRAALKSSRYFSCFQLLSISFSNSSYKSSSWITADKDKETDKSCRLTARNRKNLRSSRSFPADLQIQLKLKFTELSTLCSRNETSQLHCGSVVCLFSYRLKTSSIDCWCWWGKLCKASSWRIIG